MKETKLYKLLITFSHQERQRFIDFLKSVYFNQNDELLKFFEIIKPTLIKTNPIAISVEEIWASMYKKQKYNNTKFHRLCSDLLKQAEKFLAFYQFSHNKQYQQILTIHALNEKKIHDNVPYAIKSLSKDFEETQIKDADFFYLNQLFEIEQKQFNETERRWVDEQNLKRLDDSLDIFYFIQKLQHCTVILHYRRSKNLPDDILFVKEIIAKIEKDQLFNIKIIELYYLIIKTQIEPNNEENFYSLVALLKSNTQYFSRAVLKDGFVLANQFSIKKINSGESKFLKELFNMYDTMMQLNLLVDSNGEISQWEFKNIVIISLRLNEIKWTENFINFFANKLPKNERENALNFNNTRLYFAKNEYEKVINLLQSVKFNDLFYLLDSKVILIKTFYEVNEYETLKFLLDSFSLLLRRKKGINEAHKIVYLNFVKVMNALINGKKIQQWLNFLEKNKNVAELSWLIEKLNKKNKSNSLYK